MREIEFRGKRKDNGEWVYGGYMKNTPHDVVAIWAEKDDGTSYGHEVFPETVGEFTGLTDKNGVKIFEGDIVLRIIADSSGRTNRVKCLITFERGCFMITRIEQCPFKQPGWSFHNDYKVLTEYEGYFEIIGNIRDNPELLEQDKE